MIEYFSISSANEEAVNAFADYVNAMPAPIEYIDAEIAALRDVRAAILNARKDEAKEALAALHDRLAKEKADAVAALLAEYNITESHAAGARKTYFASTLADGTVYVHTPRAMKRDDTMTALPGRYYADGTEAA